MLVFWGVSCSWNFWGCDHEPNQRWAGSLDHLWRIYRELLRVKKSKSLVLEKVLILAIPKAYQIDSDVKLKPNIHFFWCHICHHFLARGAPANIIHSIVLYVIKVLNTRTSPNSGSPLELLYFFPPHRWTAGIPGISSDWSLSCSNSMASSSSTNAWRWFVWKDWERSNYFCSKGPWILEGYFSKHRPYFLGEGWQANQKLSSRSPNVMSSWFFAEPASWVVRIIPRNISR